MTSASQIALKGLRADQIRQTTSAHNVANQITDGFAKQRVIQNEQISGGVQSFVDKLDLSIEAQQISLETDGPQNNVDLTDEMVSQIETKMSYQQNAQVIRTQNQMDQTLLDTFV